MFQRLSRYMRPYRGFFYLSVFFLFLELGANIGLPWIAGRIIDVVFKGQGSWELRSRQLYDFLLLLGFFVLTLSLAIYLRSLFAEWFSQKTMQNLRSDLFTHMQHLDMSFYHRNTVGELMSRATSDVEQIRNYCAGGLMAIAFNVIFFPCAILYMLYLNWRLTLLCLLILPVIALVAYRFSKIGKTRQRYNRKAYTKLSAVAQESLNGIRVIQNFMSQDHEIERFAYRNRKLAEGRQRSLQNWAKYMPILEVLGSFSNILALTVGGYMVIQGEGEFSLGTWVQFTSYTWMIVMPMRQLGDLINTVNFARVSSERIFSILDEELCIRSPQDPYRPPTVLPEGIQSMAQLPVGTAEREFSLGRGEVEFEDVTWHGNYEGQNRRGAECGGKYRGEHRAKIVKNIKLKIPGGSSLGIVGETGAGKSTLMNLLDRFADPDEGRVLLDGVDLRQWDLRILRAQIAYVMQEPFLFSETLSYNISFNQPSVSQDKVIRSAQRSAAHGFIGMLQQGYQTVVGERGVGLSGGQRQRMALARALVKEAPILILDDTTSAVDMETEKEIQQQLQAVDSSQTRIIIAHRLSSVMGCDKIIVMQDGEIIECGTHQKLMAQGAYYCQVFSEQQMSDEEAEGLHGKTDSDRG